MIPFSLVSILISLAAVSSYVDYRSIKLLTTVGVMLVTLGALIALICVDYLTAILARLALRKFPALRRYEESELRVIATIKLKEVTASDLFRRLNSYSKQHALYRA